MQSLRCYFFMFFLSLSFCGLCYCYLYQTDNISLCMTCIRLKPVQITIFFHLNWYSITVHCIGNEWEWETNIRNIWIENRLTTETETETRDCKHWTKSRLHLFECLFVHELYYIRLANINNQQFGERKEKMNVQPKNNAQCFVDEFNSNHHKWMLRCRRHHGCHTKGTKC